MSPPLPPPPAGTGPWIPPVGPSPRPRRESWVTPIVLIGLALAVIVGAVLYAGRTPQAQHVTAVTPFLPTDGHVEILHAGDGSILTYEWAELAGARFLTSGPIEFLSLTVDFETVTSQIWYRTTIRPYRGGAERSFGQELLLSPDDKGLSLYAIAGPRSVLYDDPLLVLPQNLAAGAVWQDSGNARIVRQGALTVVQYTYRAEAAAAPDAGDGCLQVDGTEVLGGQTRTTQSTWCPGQGLVTDGGATARDGFPATADPRTDVRLDGAPSWAGVGGWRARSPELAHGISVAPPMAPNHASTSTFVMADSVSGDLVGFVNSGTLNPAWRAHPGGRILALGQFGTVAVAATSGRELVAYDQYGQYLWRAPTSDLVQTQLVRLDADRLISVSLDGTVSARAIRTGALAWQHKMPVEIRVTPVSDGSMAIVIDNAGRMVALDAADGDLVWTRQLNGAADNATVSEGVVGVSLTLGEWLEGYALDSGDPKWRRYQRESARALYSVSGGLVVATDVGFTKVTTAGGEAWHVTKALEASAVAPGNTLLLGATTSALFVVDLEGKQVSEWPISVNPNASDVWIVPGHSKFLALDSLGWMLFVEAPE